MEPEEVTEKLSIALKQPLKSRQKQNSRNGANQVAGVAGKSDADEITRFWFGT